MCLSAVFQDVATPGSGAWLAAIPADPMLVLPDAELAEVIWTKLLATMVNVASVCPACGCTAIDLSHVYMCVSLSHLCTVCHDVIACWLELAC